MVAAKSRTDEELVWEFLDGDTTAGEALSERLRAEALRVARRALAGREDAEDVCQEALCIAFGKLRQLRKPAAVASWVRSIALNQCYQRLRASERQQLVLFGDPGEYDSRQSAAPDPDALWLRHTVLNAVAELTPAQRSVVEGHYLAGRSQLELAGSLQLPLVTVKSRMQKARRKLREEMLTIMAKAKDSKGRSAHLGAEALRALRSAANFTVPEPEDADPFADPFAEPSEEGPDRAAWRLRAIANMWVGPHGVIGTDTHRFYSHKVTDFAPLGDCVVPPIVGRWLAEEGRDREEGVLAIRGRRGTLALSPDDILEFDLHPEHVGGFDKVPTDLADTVQPEWQYTVTLRPQGLLEALARLDAFYAASPVEERVGCERYRTRLTVSPEEGHIVVSPEPMVGAEVGWDVQLVVKAPVARTGSREVLNVWLNRFYLFDCVEAMAAGDAKLEIRLSTPLQTLTFRAKGTDTPVAAMMPMLGPDEDPPEDEP